MNLFRSTTYLLGIYILGLFATLWASNVQAQAPSWEYSPYQMRVFVAVEPGLASPELLAELTETLQLRARVVAGVTWKLTVTEPATKALATDMLGSLSELTAEQLEQQLKVRADLERGIVPPPGPIEVLPSEETSDEDADADESEATEEEKEESESEVEAAELSEAAIEWGSILSTRDKVMLLAIHRGRQGYVVDVREFCCHTRQLGPSVRRTVMQRDYLLNSAFQAFVDAFLPIVRIEDDERKTATATIRAGGLVVDEENPSLIKAHDVLYPVIRRNDRVGNPAEGGIRIVDWTYMWITERTGADVQCDIHSGYRAPLGGRSSRRVQKYGLAVKLQADATILQVETRGDSPRPLAGYEIFAQDPETEESNRVGLTDWRGRIVIRPPADKPLTQLYVKNGGMLLARLPMVPGYFPEMTAQMVDDEGRLEAEAFVRGMQGRMMDVVAKREFISSSIRRRIEEGKLEEAQQLLDDFRALPTFSELDATLDRKKNDVVSSDRRTQANIDQLFSKTHEMLVKYLDPAAADKLESEINRAGG